MARTKTPKTQRSSSMSPGKVYQAKLLKSATMRSKKAVEDEEDSKEDYSSVSNSVVTNTSKTLRWTWIRKAKLGMVVLLLLR
jgi:hypothetical protein